jgi:putative membrane protein insertion efficiency factor
MSIVLLLLAAAQPPYETNPIKLVIKSSFDIYQQLVSTSQGDVCNFSPSCSQFGREALEKHGIIWGSLMTADRLMRCNPWAHTNLYSYYSGIKNSKIYDPIERNFIFGNFPAIKPLDTTIKPRDK